MDISKFVVRAAGKIDRQASATAFLTALDLFEAEEATENGVIAEAVSAVFDKYPGASVNMPALVSSAAQHMNSTPGNFAVLSERIKKYVQVNSQGEKSKEHGRFPNPDSLFIINKGKGGGVRRRSDLPPAV
jgi:hypothetical protein